MVIHCNNRAVDMSLAMDLDASLESIVEPKVVMVDSATREWLSD